MLLKTALLSAMLLMVAAQSPEQSPEQDRSGEDHSGQPNVIYQGPPVIVIPEGGGGCGCGCNQAPPQAPPTQNNNANSDRVRELDNEIRDIRGSIDDARREYDEMRRSLLREFENTQRDVARLSEMGKSIILQSQ